MKFGLDVATTGAWSDPRVLVDLAVDAERHRWDGFFLWDIFLPDDESEPVADPWIALAAIAAATDRIRIGAMVTPLPRRQPWDVARQLLTLDHLSQGRVVFGAGLGWRDVEFTRLGLASDRRTRAGRLDEGLELVDGFMSGRSVSFHGRHHQIDAVRLLPTPVQRPRIPIWLATGWPRRAPLERASRWDGVYLMTNDQLSGEPIGPGDVATVAEEMASRRDPGAPFELAANIATFDEPDGGEAIATAMASAGATWAIELTPDDLDDHRSLIRRGPPHVRIRPG
jgi:alkanesulfonate monooxygenase SsuD/methylene tetrahydromethanopterin reductase-like flavin-dependent oxidoreductase (luciferase family)